MNRTDLKNKVAESTELSGADADRAIGAVLDAITGAGLMDQPEAAERRAGVKAHLKTAAKMAALLEKTPITDETEPAPVYRV